MHDKKFRRQGYRKDIPIKFIRKFSKVVQIITRRKLWSIDIAMKTNDLNVPPGNRKGQHSIRINDQ